MAVFLRGKVYHYEFYLHGERYRGTTNQRTEKRAITVESQKRAEALTRNAPATSRKAPTLDQAAKLFLAEIREAHEAGNLAANTVRHYQNAWDAWLKRSAVALQRVDRIRASHIAALRFPGGAFTGKNARQALGHILHWCAEKGWIIAAPKIKSTRTTGRKLRYTQEMQAAMLAHMDRDCAAIFTIMLDALMRPEEVMEIRWANVEWEQNRIFIPEGKTAAARRYVPMSDRVIELLKARQGSNGEWVFPSRVKAKGHRVTIAKQFRQARKAAGIPAEYKLYGARHTGASELSEMGVDLLTMRTMLGHEDISTTNKYLHGDVAGVRETVNKRNNRRTLALVGKRA